MTKNYDATAQSGYLRFSNAPIVMTKTISSRVICDLDAAGFPVGIEFIDISSAQFTSMTQRLELLSV